MAGMPAGCSRAQCRFAAGVGLALLHTKPSEPPLPRRCNFQADIKKQLGIGSHTLPHSTSSLLYE